jgi:hypothetical protein
MPRKYAHASVEVDVTVMSGDMSVQVELRKHNSTSYLYAQVGAQLHRLGLDLTDKNLILVTQTGHKIIPHDVFGRYLEEHEKETFLENARLLGDQPGIALKVAVTAVIQQASGDILPWYLIDAAALQAAERHLARQEMDRVLAATR